MSASVLRTVASPSRAAFKNVAAPKSIMRRPATLPLSPNPIPIANTVSIIISPAPKSPHVRFPNSASLVSVFTAHSPNTYDRAAITVSPNPLALPAWGDRVFSPASGTFRSSEATKATSLNRPVLSVTFKEGDVITAPGKAVLPPSQTKAGARFRQNLAKASKPLPRDTMGSALTKYPRSPYPSAPMEAESEVTEQPMQRRASVTGATRAARPASLTVPRAGTPVVPELSVTTVNANSVLSPVPESAFVNVSPETRLSNAFWESLSMEQPKSILIKSESKPVNELDVPVSAVPKFTFGTRDGALWSPGLPRKQPVAESLVSPSVRSAFGTVTKELMSPAPSDPFAAFPSFAAVLSMGESITYPAPVVREA